MVLRNFEITDRPREIDALVEARLRGDIGGYAGQLPPLGRDEDPADIFIDLAHTSDSWMEALQATTPGLMATWLEQFQPAGENLAQALGELCYLAARVWITNCLPQLAALARRPDATVLQRPGEDLQLRALRSLVGLLEEAGDRAFEYRGLLEGALEEPRLALTALIGLIGVWPDEAVTFLRRLPPNADSGDLLQIGLELAFPRRYLRN